MLTLFIESTQKCSKGKNLCDFSFIHSGAFGFLIPVVNQTFQPLICEFATTLHVFSK